jgi:CubicO group peptidase (beta-lactamase class C family)
VDDGLLSLEAPASQWLPAWRGDASRGAVTLRQLLDFTSGLEPAFELHQDGFKDRDAVAVSKPLVAKPGRAFIYGPCGMQVFHAGLAAALQARHETPVYYLEHQVLRPLRLGPQRYAADASGKPLLASGFMLTAREWLRMGQLMLRQGRGVVPASLYAELVRGSRANAAYGMGIWNNRAASGGAAREVDVEAMLHRKWPDQTWAGACLCTSAPADLLACIGSHGQRLYVVPSQGLVIVRLAQGGSFNDAAFLRRLWARP